MEKGEFPPITLRSRHPLVAVLAAAVCGILLDRFRVVPLNVSLKLAVATGIGAWVFLPHPCRLPPLDEPRSSTRRRFASFLVLLSIACVFAGWHHFYWRLYPQDSIALVASHDAKPVCLKVVAMESPRIVTRQGSDPLRSLPDQTYSSFEARATMIRVGERWEQATGRLAIQVSGQLLDVRPGDRLRVFGKLRRPSVDMNEGEFSAFDFARSKRLMARLGVNYPAAVERLERDSIWNPKWYPARLREHCRSTLWRYLPKPQAELAAALMLGDRQYLDKQRTDAFMHTGTVHLLAISGLHVNILAWLFFVAATLAIVPRRLILYCVMLVTAVYAIMAGARAPVIRASILVYVYCLSQLLNRDGLSINSLAAAALIVLGLNPSQLFHAGAQLSFLAVAAMIWFLPMLTARQPMTPIERLIARSRSYLEVIIRNRLWALWRIWLASLVIWLVALPLVMYRFHIVSPSALVLNLFLWVPLAIALLFGFGVLVFGWLCPPIAELCGWFCSKALYAMEACVQFAEPQPASHFWVAGPSVGLVLIFYTILFVGVGLHYLPRQRMFWAGLAFVVFAIGFVVPLDNDAAREESSVVQATFLSVGHGGCVVLTFPDGKTWLYDAGSLGATDTSTEKISSFLWSRGITRLEAIVLSHADIDHFNAVPGLLERFPVKRAIVSHAMFVSHDEAIAVLRKSLLSARVPIEVVAAGDNLSPNGQVVVSVLHPDGTLHADNDNANSLVLLIEHANKSLLLTGDLESEGLDRVLAEYKLNCDVALAPHHGSARSRPADFVRWCSPEYVVVSNGANSKSGAGPAEYAKAGCALFETCRYGSVTAKLSHQGVDVVPYLDAAAGVSLATCLD